MLEGSDRAWRRSARMGVGLGGTLLKGYENFQIRQIARGLEVFMNE